MSDNIDRAIGRIEGILKLILDSQTRADKARRQLYEAIESLRADNADYRRRLEAVEKRLDAMEKPVAEIAKWRERSIGSIVTISGIAALVGGGMATGWQKILEIFR